MKYSVPLLSILLIFTATSFADNFNKDREISRTFKINEETEIQIINKYGNIQVVNWEKDSVMIQIKISVTGTKLSKVNKTFNYIDADFTANPYYVIVNTIFKNDRNNFWTDVSDITNSIFKGGSNTQINYTIFMPENNALKIKNKFGNIYLTNRSANTEIELSNGDFKANDITGYLQMEISYGSVSLKNATNANIEINYGDLRLKKINELDLDSKSSTIDCDEINKLNIISKRDKFYLGDVSVINGRSSFSELQIDYLVKDLKLDTNFGEVLVEMTDQNFSGFTINSTNTDITATFSKESAYAIELVMTKRSTVFLPDQYDILSQKQSEEDEEETILKANSGEVRSNSPVVDINQKSGTIRLSNK